MHLHTRTVVSAPSAFLVDEDVPEILIEQTRAATVEAFTKICGAVSVLESDATDFSHGDKIDGIISFVGDLTWSLVLVLPFRSAENMAQKFAGFEIPYDSLDMGDVVGELTNVLAGVLCGRLEDDGVHSQISLPTVTRGSNFELLMTDHLISKQLFFTAGSSHFMVRIVVAKHK